MVSMKRLRWMLVLSVVVVLLGGGLGTVRAMPPTPHTPPKPPLAPLQSRPTVGAASDLATGALELPPLKAVLVVGPIDGDDGSWTTQEKQHMDLAAAELEANGVVVHKFYTPNNDWEQIKAAADGANFFLYRGHGVYWSPMPHPTVGGFALKGKFVSSDDIRNDLHLAPNAIVMLYGCFTAGSSSSDETSISADEAQRRVAQYSDPFLDIGVAGYYANWYGNAFQMLVRYLFQGKTLGETYETYFDFNSATVERYDHPDHSDQVMWLDKDFWDGKTQYNNAYTGLSDPTLSDLFSVAAMDLAPSMVTYLAEPSFPSRTFDVLVGGTGSEAFTWTVEIMPADASWIDVQPPSGNSGQQMSVVVTPNGKSPGTYQATIRVVADNPDIADQTVSVTLRVWERVYSTSVPLVLRSSQ
jgi:hypothetical protein